MSRHPHWKAHSIALVMTVSFLLMTPRLRESCRFRCCHGFSVPPNSNHKIHHLQCSSVRPTTTTNRHFRRCLYLYPSRLEDWDRHDVESWLSSIGFGRYAASFAKDYSGIGVDGDRLVYLGTEDQLDHIEYQLELIGVDNRSDQLILGSSIIDLVAAEEVTPDLLASLEEKVPSENRDDEKHGACKHESSNGSNSNGSNSNHNSSHNSSDDDDSALGGGEIRNFDI